MSKVYIDQVPPDTGRKYSITANADGTSSITDVTVYVQEGTKWGADDANSIYSIAENAQTTSAAAQSTAEGAKTTADSAATAASNAATAAANAATAAANAQSTANTANTAAANANNNANARMPYSGGTFTGIVAMASSYGHAWYARNIVIANSTGGDSGITFAGLWCNLK